MRVAAHPLESILRRLPDDLSGPALADALRGPLDRDFLVGLARYEDDRYVRLSLNRTPEWEVRLLCWRPGQSSALHDHGRSACAFRVLQGVAAETTVDGEERRWVEGDVAAVGGEALHQVANPGPGPLVTLHVYAPPLPVERPSSSLGHRVVVVGGGWCGAALAVHLLAKDDPLLRLTLVDRGGAIGRGVAYGAASAAHLLNVPARLMGIDPADPEGFLRYVRGRGVEAEGTALLPRRLYGEYVSHRLEAAVKGSSSKLRLCRGEVVDVRPADAWWEVVLADGRVLVADDVVLAPGHAPPKVPGTLQPLVGAPGLVADPWAPGALEAVPRDARVLVVGTGLTALDVLTTLEGQGHHAPVLAVSRHGRWPRPHLPSIGWAGPPVVIDPADAPATAAGLARWLRRRIAQAGQEDVPWQAVIDGVRPHLTTLWRRMPPRERAEFLDRYRSSWEVLRHRAPPPLLDALQRWHTSGWLQTAAARFTYGLPSRGALEVELATRQGLEVRRFDRIILATGAETDVRRFPAPLWPALLRRGLVIPDPLGLGILTGADGGVLGDVGRVDGLWALGALERPRHIESTAVPDLARHAAALAQQLHLAGARLALRGESGAGSEDGLHPVSL